MGLGVLIELAGEKLMAPSKRREDLNTVHVHGRSSGGSAKNLKADSAADVVKKAAIGHSSMRERKANMDATLANQGAVKGTAK